MKDGASAHTNWSEAVKPQEDYGNEADMLV